MVYKYIKERRTGFVYGTCVCVCGRLYDDDDESESRPLNGLFCHATILYIHIQLPARKREREGQLIVTSSNNVFHFSNRRDIEYNNFIMKKKK